ncbi:MAG TPA: hypothetical protein VI358_18200, partial [Pseudolabrys sp.]
FDFGTSGPIGARLESRSAGNSLAAAFNDATFSTVSTIGTSIGMSGVSRTAASVKKLWRDGVQAGTDFAIAATGIPNSSLGICGANAGGFSVKQQAFFAAGASLGGLELSFYQATLAYMTSVGAYTAFDFFVDSVNGSDARTGLTLAQSKQTLSAISTLLGSQANKRIGFSRGSVWRERLSLTSNNNGTFIGTYNSGNIPEIRCDDIVPNANFSLTSGRTNVYQVSLTVEPDTVNGAAEWPGIWENGTALALSSVDLTANEGLPGTYWHGNVTDLSSITVYVHPYGNTNPVSDGKVYEAAVRKSGIDAFAATGCLFKGIKGRRNYASYGSITLGRNCSAENCEAHEGNTHNIYYRAGCTLTNCLARDTFYPSQSPTFYVGFESTAPVPCIAELTGCTAEMTYNNLKPIQSVTGASSASPCVITINSHGFTNNLAIIARNFTGPWAVLNGNRYIATSVTLNTFAIQSVNNSTGTFSNVDTSSLTAYSANGGTFELALPSNTNLGFYNHTSGGSWNSITYTDCISTNCALPIGGANINSLVISGGTFTQCTTAFKSSAVSLIASGVNVDNTPAVIGAVSYTTDSINISATFSNVDITMNTTGNFLIAHTGCSLSITNSTLRKFNQDIACNVANSTIILNSNQYVPGIRQFNPYNIGSGATGLTLSSNNNNFNGASANNIFLGSTKATLADWTAATGQDQNSTP